MSLPGCLETDFLGDVMVIELRRVTRRQPLRVACRSPGDRGSLRQTSVCVLGAGRHFVLTR